MDALVGRYPEAAVSLDTSLEREFDERLAESAGLAFRVALGVVRNREDAEDVAQEAIVKAYRNFHRLRDRERFRAWLVRIAWRLALDRRRSAARREHREQVASEAATAPTVEDVAASREFERHLHREIDALPEKLRIVLLLAAIQGHDAREVARLLDLPEGTVKSRLHGARKRLAERLRWLVNPTETG